MKTIPSPGSFIYLRRKWSLFQELPGYIIKNHTTKFNVVDIYDTAIIIKDTPALVLATIKEVPTKDPWSSKRLTDLKLRTWCCVLSMQGLGWILLDPERWSEISNTTEQTISSREM